MSENLTPTMLEVLQRAMGRSNGHVCPTPGLRGGAQTIVLNALEKRGLITSRDPVENTLAPTITDAGRKAVNLERSSSGA